MGVLASLVSGCELVVGGPDEATIRANDASTKTSLEDAGPDEPDSVPDPRVADVRVLDPPLDKEVAAADATAPCMLPMTCMMSQQTCDMTCMQTFNTCMIDAHGSMGQMNACQDALTECQTICARTCRKCAPCSDPMPGCMGP